MDSARFSRLSLWSTGSVLSICSRGSVLSIGSVGSGASIGSIGFFGAFLGYAYGMAVAEILLRLSDRKRGLTMEIIAGVCVAAGLAAGFAIHAEAAAVTAHTGDSAVVESPVAALLMRRLLDPWSYVSVAVAIFGAVTRIRNIG